MIYRNYRNEKRSLLGFGCMRLPKLQEDKQEIDYEKAQELIDYAYSHGVNYFDTAYPYHEGQSELFIGQALKKYPRESFYLADKMPSWQLNSLEDGKRIFAEQLKKCQVDYFDHYLCHSVGKSLEEFIKRYETTGVLDYLREEKKNGRIRFLGFSFHGTPDVLEQIASRHEWDFAQIQLNYLDWNMQNAKKQYDILASCGIPCIVMEPVRGGSLCNLCDEAAGLLKAARPNDSFASWAIRFAASQPNVITVLSGMSAMDQVEDNVKTAADFTPITEEERAVLERVVAAILKTGTIPCTGCRYCMDCPAGVDIPKVFSVYNRCASTNCLPISLGKQSDFEKNRKDFLQAFEVVPEKNLPNHCVRCGQCMKHCPQSIEIPDRMHEIAALLATV
ncbi:aldo/keto reductase [Caproiciproducens sp. LBM24188]|nr:aldo/keto reductase [Oscillospiraceae bacterium]HHV31360.1 aldo/keto reductase [Clostridiales bacterium]